MFPEQIDTVVRRMQIEQLARSARARELAQVRAIRPDGLRVQLGNWLIRLGTRVKASAYVLPVRRDLRTPNPGC